LAGMMDMLAAAGVDGAGAKAAPATAALASASITPSALAADSAVPLVDGAAGSGAPLGDGADSGASGDGWGGVPAVAGPVIGSAEMRPAGLLSAVEVAVAGGAALDEATGGAVLAAVTGGVVVADVTLEPTRLVSVTVGTAGAAVAGAFACSPPEAKSSGTKLNPPAKSKMCCMAIVTTTCAAPSRGQARPQAILSVIPRCNGGLRMVTMRRRTWPKQRPLGADF